MAPANVLQGAVRLQGLTSSPTPDTQVRVAWACAGAAVRNTVDIASMMMDSASFLTGSSQNGLLQYLRMQQRRLAGKPNARRSSDSLVQLTGAA
jgi:hypothetical protein